MTTTITLIIFALVIMILAYFGYRSTNPTLDPSYLKFVQHLIDSPSLFTIDDDTTYSDVLKIRFRVDYQELIIYHDGKQIATYGKNERKHFIKLSTKIATDKAMDEINNIHSRLYVEPDGMNEEEKKLAYESHLKTKSTIGIPKSALEHNERVNELFRSTVEAQKNRAYAQQSFDHQWRA